MNRFKYIRIISEDKHSIKVKCLDKRRLHLALIEMNLLAWETMKKVYMNFVGKENSAMTWELWTDKKEELGTWKERPDLKQIVEHGRPV